MKDEMKPEADMPEVSKAAPAAPPPATAGKNRTPKALAVAALCTMPGCVHIQTGAKAGDCEHVVRRELDGIPVPDVMYVGLDESNPGRALRGEMVRFAHHSR